MKEVMEKGAILSTSIAVILLGGYYFVQQAFLIPVLITFITTAYHIDMRLFLGTIIGKRYKDLNSNNYWFKEKRFEKRLYKLIGIKDWKKYIPTYYPSSYDPSKIDLTNILKNTCTSELVHVLIVCFSFLPVIISCIIPFLRDDIMIFVITSIMAASIDSVFVIVQRYNRPRLRKIIQRKKA